MTTTLREFGGGLDSAEWTDLVAEHSRSGYLIDCGGAECQRLKLLECPACGRSFDRFYRSARNDPLAEHIAAEHDPSDFGLSKRGER